MNAVAMARINKITPRFHVSAKWYDP
jgi:hypothetical protein